jgi:transcriptional regulator with GAF, ATPase, and Fis domain
LFGLADAKAHWKIKGEGNAASRLGVTPSGLRSRMKKLGIMRPREHSAM